MISDKKEIMTMLKQEFNRWQDLLAGLSEDQISARQLPGNWSIKDVMAHLWAWQQRSIARLEAARLDSEPEFPEWPAELDPESEEDLDQVNAWIYQTWQAEPWSNVYRNWKEGFQRFLELGEAIPEQELLETGRYPWLGEHPLSLVLVSSYEHHHEEHFAPLIFWLRQHGDIELPA